MVCGDFNVRFYTNLKIFCYINYLFFIIKAIKVKRVRNFKKMVATIFDLHYLPHFFYPKY